MYRHILIPTDGSPLATKGLDHGLALAKALQAKVTIVTVTEMWSAFAISHEVRLGRPNPLASFEEKAIQASNRILEAAAEKAAAAGVDSTTVHIADMAAAEGILHAAGQHGCDLIVMASHGRRGIRRLMLGSQTAEVATQADVPVLVVR